MRILLISHFFPPLNRMASSRPLSWARHFVDAGHHVTVLTSRKHPVHGPLDLDAELAGIELREVDYPVPPSDYRATSSMVAKLVGKARFSVSRLSWMWRAVSTLRQLGEVPYDVVLSTYGPPASHILGAIYKWMHPEAVWIADYRDLWTENAYARASMAAGRLLTGRFEQVVLGRAEQITTVSEEFARRLAIKFPDTPIAVIYNGYDPDVAERGCPLRDGPREIVYTGTIYSGKRDPSPLFMALQELELDGRMSPQDCRLTFYGDRTGNLDRLVSQYGVSAWVRMPGSVTRKEALRAQREADLLLFLDWEHEDAAGTIPGKIFEYISSHTPVLAVGISERTAAGQILSRTGAGIAVGLDVGRVKEALLGLVAESRPDWYQPDASAIAEFSRPRQAMRLHTLVDECLARGVKVTQGSQRSYLRTRSRVEEA